MVVPATVTDLCDDSLLIPHRLEVSFAEGHFTAAGKK